MYENLFRRQEDVFKVIANQKRLEIIQLLSKRELNVSEMVEMLGIRQANLSQHLAVLRSYRVVSSRRQGLRIYYRLSDSRIAEACALIRQFLKQDAPVKQLKKLYPIVQDPVCGMRLSRREVFDTVRYKGENYFFCASGCRDKFVSRPAAYLKVAAGV